MNQRGEQKDALDGFHPPLILDVEPLSVQTQV